MIAYFVSYNDELEAFKCHDWRRLDGGMGTEMEKKNDMFFPKSISNRRPFMLTCAILQQEATRPDKFGIGGRHFIQTDFDLHDTATLSGAFRKTMNHFATWFRHVFLFRGNAGVHSPRK